MCLLAIVIRHEKQSKKRVVRLCGCTMYFVLLTLGTQNMKEGLMVQ